MIQPDFNSSVSHLCGDKLEVRVLGNAPWGVYKYKYPKKIQEKLGKVGEKVGCHLKFLV